MRQHLIGLAAAMAVAVVSAPAMAGCGGCAAPVASYSSCAQPFGFGSCGGWGYAGGFGYSTLAQPARYYAVQPQYYYVNQGPTYRSGHVRAGRKLPAARGWRLERLRRRLLRLHWRPVREPEPSLLSRHAGGLDADRLQLSPGVPSDRSLRLSSLSRAALLSRAAPVRQQPAGAAPVLLTAKPSLRAEAKQSSRAKRANEESSTSSGLTMPELSLAVSPRIHAFLIL